MRLAKKIRWKGFTMKSSYPSVLSIVIHSILLCTVLHCGEWRHNYWIGSNYYSQMKSTSTFVPINRSHIYWFYFLIELCLNLNEFIRYLILTFRRWTVSSVETLEDDPQYQLTPFTSEPPCNGEGGICIEKQYCLPELLADKPDTNTFYCPEQRSKGAVCCNGRKSKPLLFKGTPGYIKTRSFPK